MEQPQLVRELNQLLTAERVDEPAGFANTYHDWRATVAKEAFMRLRIGRSTSMEMQVLLI